MVTGPVKPLMVEGSHAPYAGQERGSSEHAFCIVNMHSHALPLPVGERAGLHPESRRNTDAPDIMQHTGTPQGHCIGLGQTATSGGSGSKVRHPDRMT